MHLPTACYVCVLQTAATEGGASEAPSSLVGSQGEVGSEDATGVATLEGDEQLTDQLSDMSDTGWDTDLEIEGTEPHPP